MVSGVDRARHKRQMHHWAIGRVRYLAKTMSPEEVAADTSLPLINVRALGKEVWENRAQHLYIRGVSLDEIERQTGIKIT